MHAAFVLRMTLLRTEGNTRPRSRRMWTSESQKDCEIPTPAKKVPAMST